jgi:hypothetical protein
LSAVAVVSDTVYICYSDRSFPIGFIHHARFVPLCPRLDFLANEIWNANRLISIILEIDNDAR